MQLHLLHEVDIWKRDFVLSRTHLVAMPRFVNSIYRSGRYIEKSFTLDINMMMEALKLFLVNV